MTKVLIVDDTRFSRRRAAVPLEEAGYCVVHAADGKEGLAAVEAERPDCIVTDLVMPVLGGLEFLRRLQDSGSQIPVVVVSADIQASSVQMCEELGARAFVNKPFGPNDLVAAVDNAIAQGRGVLT